MRRVKIAAHYKVKAVEKLEEYRQQIQLLCSSIRSWAECSVARHPSSPRERFPGLRKLTLTKGPRTMLFPADAKSWSALLFPYRKRTSWTEWTDESKTVIWNAAP
jgi:hypothetical protein